MTIDVGALRAGMRPSSVSSPVSSSTLKVSTSRAERLRTYRKRPEGSKVAFSGTLTVELVESGVRAPVSRSMRKPETVPPVTLAT